MTSAILRDRRSLVAAYLHAKRTVLEAGYEPEVAWQESVCWTPLTESRFLFEAAWVVLSSGMRESVIRRVFPSVTAAFGGFSNARNAYAHGQAGGCAQALRAFGHRRKIDAIVDIIKHVDDAGFDEVTRRLQSEGTTYLQTLPYIGPVTALHLAKNLGHDVVKPDRHMVRIAHACGYADPQALCIEIRDLLGEPIPVVDIVLWRFATLGADYVVKLLGAATDLPFSAQAGLAARAH